MRFARLGLDDLSDAARPLAERALAVSADGLGGPFNLMLRSPEMGARLMALLKYFNEETPILDHKCRRLTQLVLARRAGAAYAWWTHARRAVRGGEFSQAVIDALNRGERPTGLEAKQAAVVDFVIELALTAHVSDAAFEALRQQSSEAEIVELMVLCGTYTGIAYLLNVGEVGIPADAENTLLDVADPFAQL